MNLREPPPRETSGDEQLGYAPLPHLVQGGTALHIGGFFDRRAAAKFVPPELELADDGAGGITFILAPEGWGLTPHNVAFLWLDVKGYPSDTGRTGRRQVLGYVEGNLRAERYFRMPKGRVSIARDEAIATARAGTEAADHFRAAIRIKSPAVSIADSRCFMPSDDSGRVYVSPTSVLFDRIECEPLSLEIEPATEALRRLQPREITWAALGLDLSYTCGAWIPIGETQPRAPIHLWATFTNFLGRFERSVALVDRQGRIVLINGQAEKLVGTVGIANGRLRCSLRRNQESLDTAIEAVFRWPGEKAIAVLERPGEHGHIMVRASHIDLSEGGSDGGKLALLVFADTASSAPVDIVPALQLLGLTPAVARVASAVGSGLGPREAAATLGISENSARTYLKQAFTALGLTRQSELALLVARIAEICR